MLTRLIPLLMLALPGCSGSESVGECGETFCLPTDAKMILREPPANKLNVYRVEWKSREVLIFEGDWGRRVQPKAIEVDLPLDPHASLLLVPPNGTVTLKWQERTPKLLSVGGTCQSLDFCPPLELAEKLKRRR